jgi:glycosidase
MYRDLTLYNFLDNHDVNRIASTIADEAHLLPVYGLLFTVPGVPSIYYGSEWGLRGSRTAHSDADLRPAIRETAEHGIYSGVPDRLKPAVDSRMMENAIRCFAKLRAEHPALRDGSYRQLHVASEQFAFMRENAEERIVVAVNAARTPAVIRVDVGTCGGNAEWADALASVDAHAVTGALASAGSVREAGGNLLIPVEANGIRILRCLATDRGQASRRITG